MEQRTRWSWRTTLLAHSYGPYRGEVYSRSGSHSAANAANPTDRLGILRAAGVGNLVRSERLTRVWLGRNRVIRRGASRVTTGRGRDGREEVRAVCPGLAQLHL